MWVVWLGGEERMKPNQKENNKKHHIPHHTNATEQPAFQKKKYNVRLASVGFVYLPSISTNILFIVLVQFIYSRYL